MRSSSWRVLLGDVGAQPGGGARAVVGQDAVVEAMLITLLARGHARLVGVPGWRRRPRLERRSGHSR
jgi:MoxR-like ATPase